jgi:hypothetical protein
VTHIDARFVPCQSLEMKDNIALLARKIPKKLGNISLTHRAKDICNHIITLLHF